MEVAHRVRGWPRSPLSRSVNVALFLDTAAWPPKFSKQPHHVIERAAVQFAMRVKDSQQAVCG